MTRSSGFSIIELMIAITLALVISIVVLSVFVASRSSFQSTSGVAALTDGGRFALDFIQSAVRSAGYMACNTASGQGSILNPGPTPLYYGFAEALGGYEANNTSPGEGYTVAQSPVTPDGSTGDWLSPSGVSPAGLDPALVNIAPPVGEPPGTGQIIQNNDVLVVNSTLRNFQSVYVTAITDGADKFTVGASGGLAQGQLAVISDCAKSVAMQISKVSGQGTNIDIYHDMVGSPGNSAAALPVSFGIGSEVTALDTTVFYIGKGADGDGALFSYDLNATTAFTASELVPDIEAMQVLYGIDSNGTQTVSQYVTADQVPNFNAVMSVKVAVLAASMPGSAHYGQTTGPYSLLGTTVTAPSDTRARQVFEITISVRNSLP